MPADVSTVNPITKQLRSEVRQRIYQLAQNRLAIDKAEQAGYDVTAEREMNEQLYQTLVNVQTLYGDAG